MKKSTAVVPNLFFSTRARVPSAALTRWMRPLAGSAFVASLLALTGCVTATVQQVREAATGMDTGDSIAVLGRRHKTRDETETGFVECVAEKVSSGLSVMREQEFQDATFPWFEPRTAPLNSAELTRVVGNPLISERLSDMGVRYLVWIEGTTQRTEESGTLSCSMIGGGAPACFGFLAWENDSAYEASVWDVRNGTTVGKVSSEAVGTSFVPAVVVPIPMIARVRQSACNTLADQLTTFIND